MKKFLYILLISFLLVACMNDNGKVKDIKNTNKEDKSLSNEEILKDYMTLEEFYKHYDIQLSKEKNIYDIKIPEDWKVNIEDFPIGLYFEIANVFSKDIGLDLSLFKGQDVKVIVQRLKEGFEREYSIDYVKDESVKDEKKESESKEKSSHFEDETEIFKYTTNIVLFEKDAKIIGGLYNFNTNDLGPSINKKTFNQITKEDVYKYMDSKKIINIKKENEDLINMSPEQVIDEFFKAVNKKDKKRANACLGYEHLLSSLTMNKDIMKAFNFDYSFNNSYVENIVQGEIIKTRVIYPEKAEKSQDLKKDIKKIILSTDMKIRWKDDAFNSFPDYEESRFVVMKKYDTGWKIEEFNTGY